jgi:YD repeat-containing protein
MPGTSKKLLLAVAALLCLNLVQAQSDNFAKMVDFLPPAPNAAAIIKYGGLSINKNTGAPNVSIPLFSLAGRKLSTTVSIGYSSSGIKVDEIASRVGMGWALNAGGVVTRTMRGVPDELNTRLTPALPMGPNCGSYNFMKTVAQSYDVHGYNMGFDAEPDLFNFNMNGISGAFVLDNNMQPVLLNADKARVEYNFSAAANWNFKITTTDGIVYYFGGPTATEKTKRLSSCGRSYDEYLPSSWYLTKIEHPNGEAIIFSYVSHTYTYDNGVSQTMHWVNTLREMPDVGGGSSTCEPTCNPVVPSTKCINTVSTQGVLLSSIGSSQGSLHFDYISRLDCTDKLVGSIGLWDNQGTQMQVFNFYYDHVNSNLQFQNETAAGFDKTPYLVTLQERSPDLQLAKVHLFKYIDPAGRAPRLSFAQDHWGYFNGQSNGVFLPLPDSLLYRQRFPLATANRNPFEQYAQKGMLCRVIYPTGGSDSLIYESNAIASVINSAPRHRLACAVTGTGLKTTVSSTQTFSIAFHQVVNINITCTDNSGSGNYDPLHNTGRIQVLTGGGTSLYDQVYSPGTSTVASLNLPPGSYSMIISANGSVVTTSATMYHYPNFVNGGVGNDAVGGIRVKTIITGSPHEKPMIKKYFYGELSSLNVSSLSAVRRPIYIKSYKVSEPCQAYIGGYFTTVQSYCLRNAMYSNSLNNIFEFQSNPVSYASVVESLGENFEGGGTHQKFFVRSDELGVVEWGDEILDAPLTNFSAMFNGKIKEDILLKKAANGLLIPLKKTIYTYKIEETTARYVSGYKVAQEYQNHLGEPAVNCPPATAVLPELVNAFDMMRYDFNSMFVYADAITEISYDENGQNPLTKQTLFFYENPQHHQLTRTETNNSKGELQTATYTYPHNYAGQAVYDNMISRHIISPVISTKSFNGTGAQQVELSETKTNYANWGNGNYAPATVTRSTRGGAPQTEGTINAYDDFGNILQFTGKDGVVNAIIWGYGNQHPVAKISGATYAQAIAAAGVPTQSLQTSNEADLRGYINNIRTNIPGAMVTTYTYKRLVGVTGITDVNNRTSTYSYDAFHRLLDVKDADGNVLKRMSYEYAGALGGGGFVLYFNDAVGQSFIPQSCQGGYTSYQVTYAVPQGKHLSLVSVADANALAQADIAANGQAYANRFADCAMDGPCTAVNQKKINCRCETASRINSSSYQNANGTWTCIYYYRWSDGSRSPDYSEITTTNCKEIIEL